MRHPLNDEERNDLINGRSCIELLGVGMKIGEDGQSHDGDQCSNDGAAGEIHDRHLADFRVLGGEDTLDHGLISRLPDRLLQKDPAHHDPDKGKREIPARDRKIELVVNQVGVEKFTHASGKSRNTDPDDGNWSQQLKGSLKDQSPCNPLKSSHTRVDRGEHPHDDDAPAHIKSCGGGNCNGGEHEHDAGSSKCLKQDLDEAGDQAQLGVEAPFEILEGGGDLQSAKNGISDPGIEEIDGDKDYKREKPDKIGGEGQSRNRHEADGTGSCGKHADTGRPPDCFAVAKRKFLRRFLLAEIIADVTDE